MACAGDWRALSCAACELLEVSEDHQAELEELATRGGAEWVDTEQGATGTTGLRQALDKHTPPKPRKRSPKFNPRQETQRMARKNRYDSMPAAARKVVASVIAGETSVAEGYEQLQAACSGGDVGTRKALEQYVYKQRKLKGTSPRAKKTVSKLERSKKAAVPSKPSKPKTKRVSKSAAKRVAIQAAAAPRAVAELEQLITKKKEEIAQLEQALEILQRCAA